jgi:hypothetical protein
MYPRSISVHLQKDTSSSTVARTVISAPILTSTTNSKMANQEGVHCGGFRTDETTASDARMLAEKIQAEEAKAYLENPRRRFVDILKEKLRRRQEFEKLEEAVPISRKRAETMNLCKDKIKNLTGNGHIRRKSINPAIAEQHLHRKESQAALITANQTIRETAHLEFDSQPDNDSHFGSLSRSFNSALEKLDFRANSVSFLCSRSSIFNMRKVYEKEVLPSVNPYHPPNTPRPAFANLAANTSTATDKATDNPPQPTMYETAHEEMEADMAREGGESPPKKVKITHIQEDEEVKTDHARWMRDMQELHQGKVGDRASQIQYSEAKPGYINSPPYTANLGGVNSLRMHREPMVMARLPTAPDFVERTDGKQTTARAYEMEGLAYNELVLDDAIIHSPSTGDLSSYTRTPQAEKTMTPAVTPTKTETKKKNTFLEKLYGRKIKHSTSIVDIGGEWKTEQAPPVPTRSSSLFMPSTPSPLRTIHTRQEDKAKRYGIVGMPSPKVEKDEEVKDGEGKDF